MSGPARKKSGETPGYWAEGADIKAAEEEIKPYLDGILTNLPKIAERSETVAIIRRILLAYTRNRQQPSKESDHRAVTKRRADLLKDLPGVINRMAVVIEDGAPESLSAAFDAVSLALVELQQDPPEGYSETEERARNAAIVALMDVAEEIGIFPEKIIHYSGLLNYKNEDQFTRALRRAKEKFSGHN